MKLKIIFLVVFSLLFSFSFATSPCYSSSTQYWQIYEGDWGCVAGKDLVISYINNNTTRELNISNETSKQGIIFVGKINVSGADGTIGSKNGKNGVNVTISTYAIGSLELTTNGGKASTEYTYDGSAGGRGGSGGNVTINTNFYGYRATKSDYPEGYTGTLTIFKGGNINSNGQMGQNGGHSPGNGSNAGDGGNAGNGGNVTINTEYIMYLPSIYATGANGGLGGYCTSSWNDFYGCNGGAGGDAGNGGNITIRFSKINYSLSSTSNWTKIGEIVLDSMRLDAKGGIGGRSSKGSDSRFFDYSLSPNAMCDTLADCTGTTSVVGYSSAYPPGVTPEGKDGGKGGDIKIINNGSLIPKIKNLTAINYGGRGGEVSWLTCSGGFFYSCSPKSNDTKCLTEYTDDDCTTPYAGTQQKYCYQRPLGLERFCYSQEYFPGSQYNYLTTGPQGRNGGDGGEINLGTTFVQSSTFNSVGGKGMAGAGGGRVNIGQAGHSGDGGNGGDGGDIFVYLGIDNHYSNSGGDAGEAGTGAIISGYVPFGAIFPGNGGSGGNGGDQGTCTDGCGIFNINYTAMGRPTLGGTAGRATVYTSYDSTIASWAYHYEYGQTGADGIAGAYTPTNYTTTYSSSCGNNIIDSGEQCEVGGEYTCSLLPGLAEFSKCNTSTCLCIPPAQCNTQADCEVGEFCDVDGICKPDPNPVTGCEVGEVECGDGSCCEIGGCAYKNICENEECVPETITTCKPNNTCELGSNDCVIPDPDPNPGICGDRARTYLYVAQFWPVDSVYCLKGLPNAQPDFPEVGESASWNCVFNEMSSELCTAYRLTEGEDFGERDDGTFNSIVDFSANYGDGKLELYTQCLVSDLGKLSIPSKEINGEDLGCGVTKEIVGTKNLEIEPGLIELNFKIKEPCEVCERTIYLNIKQASEKNVAVPDFNFVSILLIILTVIFVLKFEKK